MGNYIMATTSTTNKNSNLFYQLYSKSNDLTQSGFTCLSAIDEKDTSFDISGSNGEITDSNGNTIFILLLMAAGASLQNLRFHRTL